MHVAATDYGWINNNLHPYTKLKQSSLMPGQIVYLRLVCAIVLAHVSRVMPDEANDYGNNYMEAILQYTSSMESLSQITAALQSDTFYDELNTLMALTTERLITTASKQIEHALPYPLTSTDRALLCDFLGIRLPRLAADIEHCRFRLV